MSTSRADSSASVTFTDEGAVALDELATLLTANCSKTPEGIVGVLDEVMHTHLDDLAASLDTIAARHPPRRHSGISPGSSSS